MAIFNSFLYVYQRVGFRVVCFGNKSHQPSCHLALHPAQLKYTGQHPRPGRNNI